MGVHVRYGSIAVGAYSASMPGSHHAAFADQYWPSWDRGGARGPRTWRDASRFASLWPRGRFGMGTGDAVGFLADVAQYEPFSVDGAGCQTVRWIRGYSRDSTGAILANAIVQAFVTSTDAPQVAVESNNDGFFAAPTETLPGVAHYLVAYKTGAPDVAGTTVNTLTSTDIAGG